MPDRIEAFLRMLEAGRDSALLRFSLGNEYAAKNDFAAAAGHFEHAVELDPGYSAAWKGLGKSLEKIDRGSEAAEAFMRGIEAAEAKGDRQAAREMTVFLRRLQKKNGTHD